MEYKLLVASEFKYFMDQFCDLHESCFNGPSIRDNLQWRYLDNPYNELLMCVALDKERLVANLSASPCQLLYKGQIKKAAESINGMTAPDYGGRGLFPELAKILFEHMKKKGYFLTFGFPNYISNRILSTKSNWTILYEIPTLELEVQGHKNLNIIDQVDEDDSFDAMYAQYFNPNKSIYVNKTKPYLKWRYYENEDNMYKNFIIKNTLGQVRSMLVCKEYKDILNIVDYLFSQDEDIEPLISQAIYYATKLNKKRVTAWSQLQTPEHNIFQKYGFRNNAPITYFGVKLLDSAADKDYVYDFRNWSVNAGDDNIF